MFQWLLSLERKLYSPMKQKQKPKQDFLGRERKQKTCRYCKHMYYEGALDFLSDEFKCPNCDNRRETK